MTTTKAHGHPTMAELRALTPAMHAAASADHVGSMLDGGRFARLITILLVREARVGRPGAWRSSVWA